MVHRFLYEKVLAKQTGFTKQDLDLVNSGISETGDAIRAPFYDEKGVFHNAPSRMLFPIPKLEALLEELKTKRGQILAELSPRPSSSRGSNGGSATEKRGGRTYKVHTGSRGGRYIVRNGKKMYV